MADERVHCIGVNACTGVNASCVQMLLALMISGARDLRARDLGAHVITGDLGLDLIVVKRVVLFVLLAADVV